MNNTIHLTNTFGTYTVVIEPDEDGYYAYVPALSGCHSFGMTIDQTITNITEAMSLHLEVMLEDGEIIPIEHEPTLITRLPVPVL